MFCTVSLPILIIIPSRCNNFSNLFLEWNSTCFGQYLCPSSGVFHCTHSNTYRFADSLLANSQHNLYVFLCVQCQTPDDGQRCCPKHVEFDSKNKFEKLLHLLGIIIRMGRDTVQNMWSFIPKIKLRYYCIQLVLL